MIKLDVKTQQVLITYYFCTENIYTYYVLHQYVSQLINVSIHIDVLLHL